MELVLVLALALIITLALTLTLTLAPTEPVAFVLCPLRSCCCCLDHQARAPWA